MASQPQMVLTKSNLTHSALMIALFTTIVFSFADFASAQRDRRGGEDREWDPRSYVQGIDRDKNGYLDKTELNGRMRDYIQKQGHNTDKPVSIKRIVKVYEDKLEAKANDARLAEREKNRVLPKFGTDEVLEKVPTFAESAEANGMTQGRLEDLYEKDIQEMVRGYMSSLDKNKDGWLDSSESERIRTYIGEDADKDGNDKLGDLEIAEALKKRQERDKSAGGRGGRDRGSRDRGGRGGRGSNNFSNDRSKSVTSSPTSKTTTTPTPAKTPSTPRSQVAREQAYVDSIYTKYDKDKDGFLVSSELKGMSPSMSKRLVDSDGDKKISREEAGRALSSNSSSSNAKPLSSGSSSSKSKSGRADKGGRYGSKSESSKSESTSQKGSSIKYDTKGWENVAIPTMKRPNAEEVLKSAGAKEEFLRLDKDKNGQVTMIEFRNEKTWTDELADSFYAKDTNGDGVLTTDELK